MCCFSGPVVEVKRTNIFARIEGKEQFVVYRMEFSTDNELAMILPIPVVAGSADKAVRFIDLEHYGRFFADVGALFPTEPVAASLALDDDFEDAPPPLIVHEVGAYDASFVPTVSDFGRLDERFRMPERLWTLLPDYQDFGFAVFKLGSGRSQRAHPMAFTFPTRDPESLFFPTLHVHDGDVHELARFDHYLYAQAPNRPNEDGWEPSDCKAGEHVDVDQTRGIVRSDPLCYRRSLFGKQKNRDVISPLFTDASNTPAF